MADKWKLCRVDESFDRVSYFTPETFEVNFKIKDFIETHYPDYELDKNKNYYYYLIQKLLEDGWEPYAYSMDKTPGANERTWCFRKRIEI